jgi:putative membrane protein
MTLEGLPNPEAMRDFLYSRMRGAHTAAPAATNAAPEPLQAVLLEIASELRSIREALEARKA